MIYALLNSARRFYFRHPIRLAISISGVALGVAVFVGVELANDSARRAFAQTESELVGRATHMLVGVGSEIPTDVYRRLRREHGPVIAAPVIESRVRLLGPSAQRIVLLGVDPVEELDFRAYSGLAAPSDGDMLALLTVANAVLVPRPLAEELDIDLGASLEVALDDRTQASLTVVGVIGDAGADGDLSNLPLVADIALLQELRGSDTLTRIDLILTSDDAAAIEALALPDTTLLNAADRNAVFDELSTAFRTNLTALSLLALLVGVFLIYATISFAVVQRRSVFGIYRALGTPRSTLLVSVLLEAAIIGAIAAVAGVALGHALSRGLLELVLRTISDLYFSTAVHAAIPSTALSIGGFAIGLSATVLAAIVPAYEAMQVSPRAAMNRAALERSIGRLSRLAAWLSLPCALCGLLAIQLAPRSLPGAFIGLFLVIVAAALVVPVATVIVMRIGEPLLRAVLGVPGALAARGVSASLSRTGVAAAALTIAIAAVVGVGLMIGSFRGSVEQWLDSTLLADFYIEVDAADVLAEQPLATPELDRLASLPGVRGLSLMQFDRLPTRQGLISVRAVLPGPDGWGLTIVDSVGDDALERLGAGGGIFVSEALAFRQELAVGETLTLPTSKGARSFRVLASYREFNTDGGGVLLPIAEYQAHWTDTKLDGIGVYLDAGADALAAETAIQAAVGERPGFFVRSTRAIRNRSLDIFDRTFQITEVLRLLAGLVAFLGLIGALLNIEMDRARETAILRAIGFSPRQISSLSITQTALLGIAAGVLALPTGYVMAALLVNVINRRSFGWGMELTIDPQPLMIGIVLAASAAIVAGIYPAIRLARGSIVAGLREE